MSRRFHSLFVNVLTFSRVPLIFAFMAFAVAGELTGSAGMNAAAVALMGLAGFSDLFDGLLARRWRVVSLFGKLADPLMDKIFFIVTFPTLLWLIGAQGENTFHFCMMLAFTVLYILRDQWVTFLRAVASSYHADVSAMWLGKVRTALSFPAAGFIYVYLAFGRHLPALIGDAQACAAAEKALLWGVYSVEGFLIALNVYSCAVYTRVYWPYIVKAVRGEN